MITIPGKIPITIHPLFWLLAAFIGWMSTYTLAGTFLAVAVILFSVVFHEYGHALTALIFKQTTRIELAAFGGFTYRQGRKLKLWEEFLVVLNGPLAGFLLFVISYIVLQNVTIENASFAFLLKFMSTVNLFWTIINLVPVLPLDGGHLLSIILEAIFGFKGIKIAIFVGLTIGSAISIFFFVIGSFLAGALFLILTFESFRSLRYYKMLTEQDRDTDLQQLMKEAETAFKAGNESEALQKFQVVRDKTKQGILYTMATEELAQILKHQGRPIEAYAALSSIEKSLSQEMLPLYQQLAFENRDFKRAAKLAKDAFQFKPTYETALINASSYAAIQQVEPAVGWLECAMREGAPTLHEEIRKKEFDAIRSTPAFQNFVQVLKKG